MTRRNDKSTKRREITKAEVERAARLSSIDYELERKALAKRLKIRPSILDMLVKAQQPKEGDDDFSLPHWNVQSWPDEVSSVELLNDLRAIFHKYIYAPAVVSDAAALWIVHAWTIDAGDISPFFVLVSPTKR